MRIVKNKESIVKVKNCPTCKQEIHKLKVTDINKKGFDGLKPFNFKGFTHLFLVAPIPVFPYRKTKVSMNIKPCYGVVAYNIEHDCCTGEHYMDFFKFKENNEKELTRVRNEIIKDIKG